MQVNPYLFYNGNCEEALKYYQKVLGARIEATHLYEGGPAEMPIPPEWKKKIMHARVTIDGEVLMASGSAYNRPRWSIERAAWKPSTARRVTQMRSLGTVLSTSVQADRQGPSITT